MRIAQNGVLKVVEKVNILILALLFEVKLVSLEIMKKARPATTQIEESWRFNFDEKPGLILNILVL